MKASELRVGNYINDMFNGRCEVRGITENGIWIRNNGSPAPETVFNPIPLTEELLISAGFEKEDMADLGIHVYIPISETADYCLNWSGGTIWLEQHDTGIKLVHQLQNLYFSLTGEELTFNLK